MNAKRTAWAYLHRQRIKKSGNFISYIHRYQSYLEKQENSQESKNFSWNIIDLYIFPDEVLEYLKQIAIMERQLKVDHSLYAKRFVESFRMHYETIVACHHMKYRKKTILKKELRIDQWAYYLAKQCAYQETIHWKETRHPWQEWPWVTATMFLLSRTEGILSLYPPEGYLLPLLKPIEQEIYTKDFVELVQMVVDAIDEEEIDKLANEKCKALLEVEGLQENDKKIIRLMNPVQYAIHKSKPENVYHLCKTAELFDSLELKEYEDYFRAAGFFRPQQEPFGGDI